MRAKREARTLVLRKVLITVLAASVLFILAQASSKANQAAQPSIQITLVPPRGEGSESNGTIGGKAGAANLKDCKVVIFARTDKWYVQPTVASPYTPIGDDGRWETDIHLGYEYAALLVKSSYEPPATTGALPKVAGAVLAIERVTAKKE